MKGNEKIALTAEAVCFMRSKLNADKYSKYFVSEKINRKFRTLSRIIPTNYLQNIFEKRVQLSKELDKFIEEYKPEQIIELACGYSTRGLIMSQKDKKLVYIESDFNSVINNKRKILREIENKEKIKISKNHYLIEIDVVKDNLYDKLGKIIDKNKRTLIVSETLNNYLEFEQYNLLTEKIFDLLKKTKKGAYLSHEGNRMLKGILGKLLLFYRDKISKTRSYNHFDNENEIKKYLNIMGFKKITTKNMIQISNIIYFAEV